MTDPNPYESPVDAHHQPANPNRLRAAVLAVVLLEVAHSVFSAVRNLPDMVTSRDATPALIGGAIAFWLAWIMVELFAAWLIWRGRAAGRWILVVSFALKGMGRIAIVWPLLIRAPVLALGPPMLKHTALAVCYSGAVLWLLLLPAFAQPALRGMPGRLGGDARE